MDSVFKQFQHKAWPFQFRGTLHVASLAGGTPTDQRVAEGHIRSKMALSDDLIREQVAKVMLERGVDADEAAKLVGDAKHLNGFKRDPEFGLFIEGRQLKAAIKEACSVAVASGKLSARGWGTTNKSLLGFVAEHVVVDDERLYLGRETHDDIVQRFVHTWRGTGIQYEEVCRNVELSFTVLADWNFSDEEWAMIWLTGENQGIGASRSQGFGKYKVIRWDRVSTPVNGARVTGASKPPAKRRVAAKS